MTEKRVSQGGTSLEGDLLPRTSMQISLEESRVAAHWMA